MTTANTAILINKGVEMSFKSVTTQHFMAEFHIVINIYNKNKRVL